MFVQLSQLTYPLTAAGFVCTIHLAPKKFLLQTFVRHKIKPCFPAQWAIVGVFILLLSDTILTESSSTATCHTRLSKDETTDTTHKVNMLHCRAVLKFTVKSCILYHTYIYHAYAITFSKTHPYTRSAHMYNYTPLIYYYKPSYTSALNRLCISPPSPTIKCSY